MNPLPWFFRPRVLRCLLAIVGTFAWLCASVVIRQGILLSSRSPLLWGTAGAGVIAGAVAWAMSLWTSDASFADWQRRGSELIERTRTDSGMTTGRGAGIGLVVFGGLLFAINTTWVAQHQDTPFDDDQGAFLITAQEIHDQGGPVELWSQLWSGSFSESNRHPLLLAIQSVDPTVPFGRVVSIVLATGLMATTLALVWRRMGPLTAGVLAVLMGTNGAWLYHVPRLVCESLLTGLAGLAWLVMFSPRTTTALPAAQPSTLNPQRALLAGVLIGLAYLTKGTGLLLFAGSGLGLAACVLWSRGGERRSWMIAGVALVFGYVITASPLLVRNQIRFGSPTYNVNSYLLWVDTYESPNAMAERMTLREARAAYLDTHSTTDLVQREATGLAWEAFIGLRTLGPAPWDDARVLCGIPLCLLGLLGLVHSPRGPAIVLILWTGVIWVTMAWYVPIAAGDRFVMPLLIPWLTLAANGLVRLLHSLDATHSANRRLIVAALLWGVASTALVWSRSEIWAS